MRHHTHHSEMVLMASAAGLCIGGATWLLSEWFHANDAKVSNTKTSEPNVFGNSDTVDSSNVFETKTESKSRGNTFFNWFNTENQPNAQTPTESLQAPTESQTPTESSFQIPTETSFKTPTETSFKTPTETSFQTPTESVQTPIESVQTPTETPMEQPNAQTGADPSSPGFQTPTQTMETIGPMKETYFKPVPVQSSPEFQTAQDSPFETAQSSPTPSSPEFETAQDSPTPSSPKFETAQSSPFQTAQSSPFQTAQSSPFETAQDSPTPSSPEFQTPFQTQKGGSRKRRMNKRNTRKRKQK